MAEEASLPVRIEEGNRRLAELRRAVAATVVGQAEVVDHILAGILAGGHLLLIGVPGLAKTLLVKTLAALLGWRFRRIQFTPDLMPSDILGSEVLRTDPSSGKRTFEFVRGPVFANLLLADEINRTPPKTQAALLEAMQERAVTAGGTTYPLAPPFLVVATQNPIEQEGTYPLPEAQLDRFLLALEVGYPSEAEEEEIASRTSGPETPPAATTIDLAGMVGMARHAPAPPHVTRHAVRIVRATRPGGGAAPHAIADAVRWGAGPRASQHLLLAAKAHALLDGRFAPTRDDVRSMVKPVLRHRLVLRFNAVAEGVKADEVLDGVLETIPAS
jgi:MoxR-like ATPase